ncbi:TraB family protein [Methanocaldococcus infernus ME]|uniref:TraB family protein n=1 Tax=Methanocaldococcus infernus (strain DSM 11812 / JCM 15783 / ME) TaxID=573063 RepID=D5VSP1_METIM|nr:TraB family protein [Methanocaldococcus infernus]ADG13594.1 TraB family protein [Methanocaldococcus infernus ME]
MKEYRTKHNSTIYLLGTAHVSKDSVESVEKAIEEIEPDVVAVELDQRRFLSLISRDEKKIDFKEVIKRGEFLKTFLYLILSQSQKEIGEKLGIKPGSEMKKAIEVANSKNIPIALIDRDIEITFSRLLEKLTFKDKINLLKALLTEEDVGEVNEELLKEMKENPEKFIEMLKELSPKIYDVFVDERDKFMAKTLYEVSKGKEKVLAIVGAGHVKGIINYLSKLDNGEEIDIYELLKVKKKRFSLAKFLGYTISLAIIIIFLYALYYSLTNPQLLKMLTLNWILFTGGLSALGVILARGRLLTALIAFVSAPITTLIPLPFVAVGTLTALVELKFTKISEEDINSLFKTSSIRELLNNNLFKILLVMTLSNLGASIGVFYCMGKFVGLL